MEKLMNVTIAFPEVIENVTAWCNSNVPDPGTITVTREGLRKLLRIVGNTWPVVTGSYFKLHGPPDPSLEMVYGKALAPKNMRDLINRVSRVWCEGDLIVSGLFVDADGKPVINPCAEED